VIKSRRWAGHVACMWEMVGTYKILVRKPEGKRSLGRLRHVWEGNIEMGHREIGYEDIDTGYLTQH